MSGNSEGDGRPFSADAAISHAIKFYDHFDRLEFLKAWEIGDWNTIREMTANVDPEFIHTATAAAMLSDVGGGP